MQILITAPSLEENENVSGISSVVRQIIENGRDEFVHFTAGRRDGEKTGTGWIAKQTLLTPRLWREIKKRQIELVHINTALTPLSILRDAALCRAAKLAGAGVVLHIHGGKYLVGDFDNKLLKGFTERMFGWADVIVVLSELEKKLLEKRWKGLEIRVLENAVALEKAHLRKPETDDKTLIFLGRLHESKGLHEIIEACRILKNEGFAFNFKCYGAGGLRDFFVGGMTAILGERFQFGGIIAGDEKWSVLAGSDIFLLPSRYGEGLPMALLEAMAAGNVVVVSEMASIGAVVADGVNGFTVEPGNAAQVVEKLRPLLSDEADWKTLRENARRTIGEKFDLTNYIEKLNKIYREIA